jgi:hypothetical protein
MRTIADLVYHIKDGTISSIMTKEEMRELGIPSFDMLKSGEYGITTFENEEVLLELKEFQNYINQKINNFKKNT